MYVKDLEMGTWVIWGGIQCNQKNSYKRQAEGEFIGRGDGNVTLEVCLGVMQPRSKECWWPPKAGRGQEPIFP